MPVSVTATLAPMVSADTPALAIDELLERVAAYTPADDQPEAGELIRRAYDAAERAHAPQKRLSGEPYIQHVLAVAMLVADLHLDADTVAAGLLHDAVEDTSLSLEVIRRQFGSGVAELVDGVTKLERVTVASLDEQQAQNLRKVLLAMARDVRVVLIKLADRLHNVRTAWVYSAEKRARYGEETLEIFAPLAGRLGIEEWRWQLEDYALKLLDPDRYRDLARWLLAERRAREAAIAEVQEQLRGGLDDAGIDAHIQSRVKHIYSIERKIRRKGADRESIYDILAIRVIVNSQQDCYGALGVVHGAWRHIPVEFDDYISAPKENGYQSLHTAVLGPDGKPVEVQIRTREMHQNAEYGVAAHWRYKEGGPLGPEAFLDKLAWIRQILSWQEDGDSAGAFVDAVKTDFFSDTVFVFTPKGEVKDFPIGSTPLDFAYRIHSDVGHSCIGAKVNRRLVPLDHELENGDVVEILTSTSSKGPSRAWLSQVRTAHARDKIRRWFKRHEKAENVVSGRALLDRELRRVGQGGVANVPDADLKAIATSLGYLDVESLLAGVGYGATTVHQVVTRLRLTPEVAEPELPETLEPDERREVQPLVNVLGAGNLLTRVAACCHPLPGDDIVGFITRGHGVSIHRRSCANVRNVSEPERLVPVSWADRLVETDTDLPVRLASCCTPRLGRRIEGVAKNGAVEVHRRTCRELAGETDARVPVRWIEDDSQSLPVSIRVVAHDREGLTHDITGIIREEGLNIATMSVRTNRRHEATFRLTVALRSVAQLARLLRRIETVRSVVAVSREGARAR
ncbi:MAG: bifunctional (p)ppGpp synthetase/guanosine-3',5'-bis(diphosphate) 3'-pyrophosphohydrolase [Chloroflexi bacterium]|nr:bifunctional (p)ppGpp synthetase/guanosine-3',5'-bis(diphosphate) 3'-pyrophosphohydrolase [Chloroflexota bacterium]